MNVLVPSLLAANLNSVGDMGSGETVLFALVALLCVVCGFGLLTARRAVSAAVNMIAIMVGLAILYIANESPFLGITQMVVYTGAVMTLVLFVIMLVGVGGDEPVSAGKWGIALLGVGLVAVLSAVVWRTAFPSATGLKNGDSATPADLAGVLFGDHVVTMELTGFLLIIAALGALTLTHRQRVRAKVTQQSTMDDKMRAYASKGVHPGQKPMPGVYASTNTAAAPALEASGDAVEESVPRVLRVRGQGLSLAEVSPEYAAAQREGRVRAREDINPARSGMPAMPGAAAPAVAQPVAPESAPAVEAAPADDSQEKEEEK
ncbi:NADH dehydrogenase [Actinomyces radicidentis]|uniref:NADH-quinone oxidoreductase subunit J n=1 Tax=Actinomyces radicidentis TaxID=111015 RepID=A0A120KKX0_ACTRD|nr:NADH-quinone oxidoreductase subunit J [Actinomyces radicidentis]AMD86581.1 NADH dehydrogenase [Actinomyces radicidentis]